MNELKWAWAYHHADEKNSESFKNFLLLAFGVLLLKAPHSRSTLPTLIHSLLNMQIARQEMIHTFVSSENSILFLIDWWHQQTTASYLLVEKSKRWRKRCKIILLTSLWVSSAVSCKGMENMRNKVKILESIEFLSSLDV